MKIRIILAHSSVIQILRGLTLHIFLLSHKHHPNKTKQKIHPLYILSTKCIDLTTQSFFIYFSFERTPKILCLKPISHTIPISCKINKSQYRNVDIYTCVHPFLNDFNVNSLKGKPVNSYTSIKVIQFIVTKN